MKVRELCTASFWAYLFNAVGGTIATNFAGAGFSFEMLMRIKAGQLQCNDLGEAENYQQIADAISVLVGDKWRKLSDALLFDYDLDDEYSEKKKSNNYYTHGDITHTLNNVKNEKSFDNYAENATVNTVKTDGGTDRTVTADGNTRVMGDVVTSAYVGDGMSATIAYGEGDLNKTNNYVTAEDDTTTENKTSSSDESGSVAVGSVSDSKVQHGHTLTETGNPGSKTITGKISDTKTGSETTSHDSVDTIIVDYNLIGKNISADEIGGDLYELSGHRAPMQDLVEKEIYLRRKHIVADTIINDVFAIVNGGVWE